MAAILLFPFFSPLTIPLSNPNTCAFAPKSVQFDCHTSLKNFFTCSSLRISFTEGDFLRAVSEGDDEKLPCVRSYENALARLTLAGDVNFQQAISVGAADGGKSAAEHLRGDLQTVVAEGISLESLNDKSTVSTRLFLPTKKIMQTGTSEKEMLASSFRRVVLERVRGFELFIFDPGAERNMSDVGKRQEEEVRTASFAIGSSDAHVISVLAEVVCRHALDAVDDGARRATYDDGSSLARISSQEVIMASLLSQYRRRNAGHSRRMSGGATASWWPMPNSPRFEAAGGPLFSAWVEDYAPLYRLQVRHAEATTKLRGWSACEAAGAMEISLTHSQLVALAGVLDMYFEDENTLPNKSFSLKTRPPLSRSRCSAATPFLFTVAAACTALIAIITSRSTFKL